MAGIAIPVPHAGFWPGSVLRVQVAEPAHPPRAGAMVPGTAEFAAAWIPRWHAGAVAPAWGVACYFATDAVISGLGEIWLGDRIVTDQELMAKYRYHMVGLPGPSGETNRVLRLPVRTVEEPCAVLPGGGNVYGHFVIETMPYLLQLRQLFAHDALPYRVLLPTLAAPWLLRLLDEEFGIGAERIERYDPFRERVALRAAILPGMAHRDAGFHPVTATWIDAFMDGVEQVASPLSAQRLFMVRSDAAGAGRYCTNEAALVAIAEAHGFVPVKIQEFPWRAQVALLRQANMILGLYGSALHGAMFSPPGLCVACVGLLNTVQSEIAALRGHRMAYLTEGFRPEGAFSVPEDLFARFLAALLAAEGG